MEFIILIPSFFIFLYTLYKLGKDDHVFLRRNVRPEQFFDLALIVIVISWIFIKLLPLNSSSFTFFVLSGSVTLYLAGKYKKLPIGRIFDFFTLSFLSAIPMWYLLRGIIYKGQEQIISLILTLVYLVIAFVFFKKLLTKVMSRTLKEGSISIYFLIIMSFTTLMHSAYNFFILKNNPINAENIILLLLLPISAVLLIRNRK